MGSEAETLGTLEDHCELRRLLNERESGSHVLVNARLGCSEDRMDPEERAPECGATWVVFQSLEEHARCRKLLLDEHFGVEARAQMGKQYYLRSHVILGGLS